MNANSSDINPEKLVEAFVLPEQNQSKLNFCKGRKIAHVENWVNNLRLTQILPSAATLYSALPEISRLKCDPKTRIEILEVMRPAVQAIARGLTKQFLNQPLILSDANKKTALITLALHKYGLDGFLVSIKELTLKKMTQGKHTELFGLAIHRALAGIGMLLLRNHQMYSSVPKNLWQNAHTLFQLAEHFDILGLSQTDDFGFINARSSSKSFIQTNYFRILLLECSRPNQLGQSDLSALYDAFEHWSKQLKLTPDDPKDESIHWSVDLSSDEAPKNKTRESISNTSETTLNKPVKSILLKPLLHKLESYNKELSIPISPILLEHLKHCWHTHSTRKDERRRTKGKAEVILGLSDIHYLLSDNVDFETFTNNESDTNERDISLSGITPNTPVSEEASNQNKQNYQVNIQNMSRGGFCVLWEGDVPNKLESGELLALKDSGKRPPLICAIRWLRRCQQGVQLGLQIVSDRAIPFAVAQTYDMGGHGDFTRALYLPPSRVDDHPASLLTPTTPFQNNDRIKAHDGKRVSTLHLNERLYATRCIQQFSFTSSDD